MKKFVTNILVLLMVFTASCSQENLSKSESSSERNVITDGPINIETVDLLPESWTSDNASFLIKLTYDTSYPLSI